MAKPKSQHKKPGRKALASAPPPDAPPPGECNHLTRDGLRCIRCGDVMTVDERLVIVSELRLKGVNRRQIQFDLSRRWKLTFRQIRRYLTQVDQDWAEQGKGLDRTRERGRIWDRLEALYMEADQAAGDASTPPAAKAANRRIKVLALQEQARIVGAYEKERIDLTSNGQTVGAPTADDARRELVRRAAELLAAGGALAAAAPPPSRSPPAPPAPPPAKPVPAVAPSSPAKEPPK